MEMMKSPSYFVTFPTVHTASVHSLTILGYFYWLVSFDFCFRLRMYEKKSGLLSFLSKLHANKTTSVIPPETMTFSYFLWVTHI